MPYLLFLHTCLRPPSPAAQAPQWCGYPGSHSNPLCSTQVSKVVHRAKCLIVAPDVKPNIAAHIHPVKALAQVGAPGAGGTGTGCGNRSTNTLHQELALPCRLPLACSCQDPAVGGPCAHLQPEPLPPGLPGCSGRLAYWVRTHVTAEHGALPPAGAALCAAARRSCGVCALPPRHRSGAPR